jgi:hypothetical protein
VPKPQSDLHSTCNACSTGSAIEMGLNNEGNIVTRRCHAAAALIRGKRYTKGYLENEAYDSPDARQAGWIQG